MLENTINNFCFLDKDYNRLYKILDVNLDKNEITFKDKHEPFKTHIAQLHKQILHKCISRNNYSQWIMVFDYNYYQKSFEVNYNEKLELKCSDNSKCNEYYFFYNYDDKSLKDNYSKIYIV